MLRTEVGDRRGGLATGRLVRSEKRFHAVRVRSTFQAVLGSRERPTSPVTTPPPKMPRTRSQMRTEAFREINNDSKRVPMVPGAGAVKTGFTMLFAHLGELSRALSCYECQILPSVGFKRLHPAN